MLQIHVSGTTNDIFCQTSSVKFVDRKVKDIKSAESIIKYRIIKPKDRQRPQDEIMNMHSYLGLRGFSGICIFSNETECFATGGRYRCEKTKSPITKNIASKHNDLLRENAFQYSVCKVLMISLLPETSRTIGV